MRIILLCCLLLIGCASVGGKAQSTERIVTISHDVASGKCGTHEGCVIKEGNTCKIIAPKPRDYLDHWKLEILGHELWHCFNEKHH